MAAALSVLLVLFALSALLGHVLVRFAVRRIALWPLRAVLVAVLRMLFYAPTLAVGEGGALPVPLALGAVQWLDGRPLWWMLVPAVVVFGGSLVFASFGRGNGARAAGLP